MNILVGLAFKGNCPDLRNTRVVDIVEALHDYNVAVGERTTLNELFFAIQDALDESNPWQFLVSSAATAKYGLSRTADWQPWKPRHPN